MKQFVLPLCLVMSLGSLSSTFAQVPPAAAPVAVAPPPAVAPAAPAAPAPAPIAPIDGTDLLKNFGVGLSLTMDIGSRDRVKRANLDANNIVRIEKDNNIIPRFILEAHYWFHDLERILKDNKDANAVNFVKQQSEWKRRWRHGPYVAVEPGGDSIINAVGMGWMIGLLPYDPQGDGANKRLASYNLGVGFLVEPSVQTLGDGIQKDRPLPKGETAIRYKETAQGGVMFLFSVSF